MFGLWSLQYWSEGSQILVQFIFYSNNVSSECSGPKGCPRKKLECDFWGRCQNPKGQIAKKQAYMDYKSRLNIITEVYCLKIKLLSTV